MQNIYMSLIKEALRCPEDYLGTVEMNTEIKVIYFTLCALGWDPVKDIALGFQINKRNFPRKDKSNKEAKAANAADFVLRDGDHLCAVGEVKHWFASDKKTWDAGIEQMKRYQEALDIRSEEHTSELQSQFHLVCRLLLEKK